MYMKLQQLKNFLLVVKHSGFRSAASASNKTQAGLSLSIKNLEEIMGEKLFIGDNKASLTPFGKQVIPNITKFLEQYEDLELFVFNTKQGNQGKVRICCVPSVLSKIMTDILSPFTTQYNNIEISLSDNTSIRCYHKLVLNEIDIAIATKPENLDNNIISIPLFSDKMGVVCLKTHPLATNNPNYQPIHWQDISPYNFIENGTCELLKNTPAQALLNNKKHTVNNMLSLTSALNLNLGVSTLPKLALPENESNLVWIPIKTPDIQRDIHLMYYKDSTFLPQVKSFITMCCETFR